MSLLGRSLGAPEAPGPAEGQDGGQDAGCLSMPLIPTDAPAHVSLHPRVLPATCSPFICPTASPSPLAVAVLGSLVPV